jgi:hypothetical protein
MGITWKHRRSGIDAVCEATLGGGVARAARALERNECLHFPEGHVDVATEHEPPLLPVYPVLQVQAPMEVLP